MGYWNRYNAIPSRKRQGDVERQTPPNILLGPFKGAPGILDSNFKQSRDSGFKFQNGQDSGFKFQNGSNFMGQML